METLICILYPDLVCWIHFGLDICVVWWIFILNCISIRHGPCQIWLIYITEIFILFFCLFNWWLLVWRWGGGSRGPRSSWRSNSSFKVCVNRKGVIEYSFITKTVSLVFLGGCFYSWGRWIGWLYVTPPWVYPVKRWS